MQNEQNIKTTITIHRGFLPILMVAMTVMVLVISSPTAWAGRDKIEYDEAEIFFELNNTDEDLGIHALIDGEAWRYLKIRDPRNRKMLDVIVQGRLRKQGLTEIFFESAEPEFGDLNPVDFFDRFPEGEYTITGRTLERDKLEAVAEITHVMPAPPVPTVNGKPMAVQCDDEEPGYDATEVELDEDGSVTIAWDLVFMSHPDPNGGGAGVQPPVEVMINNYEVVVEVEYDLDGEEFTSVFSVVLPPDTFEVTIPSEFVELGEEFKYEVLAREVSYNQTAVESCFVIVEPE